MAVQFVHQKTILKEALPLIKVIAGKKGSGKTKRILDMANAAAQESKQA